MNKFILAFLFLLTANLNAAERPDFSFSYNLANNLRTIFSNASIEREAAARIAREKAEEELARLNVRKEEILKERIEAMKILAAGTWWLVSNGVKLTWNGFKFVIETTKDTGNTACELFTDAESVANKLNAGDKRAIRGCIGLAIITISAFVMYNNKKKRPQKRYNYVNNGYSNPPACNPNPHLSYQPAVYSYPPIAGASAPDNNRSEGQAYAPGGPKIYPNVDRN
ncbi:MAG: hypothetical protein P4L22_06265 [Candidatus Babeliales bacterium]|nr:hypothetical protein [Candidatus Babeliales bacterium]